MAKLHIRRAGASWSKWNSARLTIEATLDRAGISSALGSSVETDDGLEFTASRPLCEAVLVELEGLGLDADIRDDTP